MVAKGAWLNRPILVKQPRQSNDYDVRVKAMTAIATISKSRGYDECFARSSDRDAIERIALASIKESEV